MCTKNELNIIIQKLTHIYRSVYGSDLVQVILYGSYARGDYHQDSDVDIVAIVQGERTILQKKLKKVWDESCELELEYDIILSPTVIPYDEFEKYRKDLPYYRNIAQEGVIVIA
ncbi:MAG TPA: toxin [Lachnospiraceae bacterium]|nr:toxin [Lachnospiraceae bacterium]